jgi:hypothetical protein
MNRFVLKNTFIKIYLYHFLINIFPKNNESKLDFGNRTIVLNNFLYGMEGYIYTATLFYTLGVEYYSTPQVKTE